MAYILHNQNILSLEAQRLGALAVPQSRHGEEGQAGGTRAIVQKIMVSTSMMRSGGCSQTSPPYRQAHAIKAACSSLAAKCDKHVRALKKLQPLKFPGTAVRAASPRQQESQASTAQRHTWHWERPLRW